MRAVDIVYATSDREEAERVRHALRHVSNRLEVFTDPASAADRMLRRGAFSSERRTPDLVVLDAELLGEGCYDLLREYREREDGQTVVAVVERDPEMDRVERARRAGADAYAAKPLDLQSLAELLEDVSGVHFAVVRDDSLEVAPKGVA